MSIRSVISPFVPDALREFVRAQQVKGSKRARIFEPKWRLAPAPEAQVPGNSLEQFFNARQPGQRSIHKWAHYFDIYERHLAKFRNKSITVLEIGLDRGGSIDMWLDYFGPEANYHGVDILQSRRNYACERVTVHIGDQADRSFWRQFREQVPILDVVLEDGGHEPEQQIVSLEELLPHIRPGGVYLCEDILGRSNDFLSYSTSLAKRLFDCKMTWTPDQPITGTSPTTPLQDAIQSIHLYPFVAIFERRAGPLALTSRRS